MSLTHLSLADDLMIFAKADAHSISIIKDMLDEFCNASGLCPNLNKSITFFGNVPAQY